MLYAFTNNHCNGKIWGVVSARGIYIGSTLAIQGDMSPDERIRTGFEVEVAFAVDLDGWIAFQMEEKASFYPLSAISIDASFQRLHTTYFLRLS